MEDLRDTVHCGDYCGDLLSAYTLLMSRRELLWAVYAAIHVLETSSEASWRALAAGWQAWLDYAKSTAAKVSDYH